MSKSITSAFKSYNANYKNQHTGDCVKRALSIMYGIDYQEVASNLNKIKREMKAEIPNCKPVFSRFIKNAGLISEGRVSYFGFESAPTVSEFADQFNSGRYLLLCGKKVNSNEHLTAIIDGDIWDTWDCSNCFVNWIYKISEEGNIVVEEGTLRDEIKPVIYDFVNECIAKSCKKMPFATFSVSNEARDLDPFSFYYYSRLMFDETSTNEMRAAHYSGIDNVGKKFIVKINPSVSKEENIKIIKQKLHYQIREWAYANRKVVEDLRKLNSRTYHPEYSDSKLLLTKLPDKYVPYVRKFKDRGESDWLERYYLEADGVPEDPRYNDDPIVEFYNDTLKGLILDLEDYYQNYRRYNYDY